MRAISLFLAFFAFGVACNASVEWAGKEIKSNAAIGASHVAFSFVFKNAGDFPIAFDQPAASCGCTLAKLEKTTYAPGESGELKGTYNTSGRRGVNTVTITVKGNEVEGDVRRPFSDTLKLSVTIPEVVKISPGIALWRKDSEATSKILRFEVNEALSLPLTLAKVGNQAFAAEWMEIEAGRLYELVVAPTSTAEARQAVVTVEGVNDDGKTLRFYAHLMIR